MATWNRAKVKIDAGEKEGHPKRRKKRRQIVAYDEKPVDKTDRHRGAYARRQRRWHASAVGRIHQQGSDDACESHGGPNGKVDARCEDDERLADCGEEQRH
jgi:hypothetical protein